MAAAVLPKKKKDLGLTTRIRIPSISRAVWTRFIFEVTNEDIRDRDQEPLDHIYRYRTTADLLQSGNPIFR